MRRPEFVPVVEIAVPMGTSDLGGNRGIPDPESKTPKVDLEGNPNLGPPIPQRSVVLVLDFGSQYTQLIARRVRELGVYSVSLSGDSEQSRIEAVQPTVIILSGGPNSVHESESPTLPKSFFEWTASKSIPVLGVCYGMQLIVQVLGGEVKQAAEQEYGRMAIKPVKGSQFYGDGSDAGEEEVVWMSHGDEAVRLPEGFKVVAKSSGGTIVGIEAPERHLYGLQYHPEVSTQDVEFLSGKFLPRQGHRLCSHGNGKLCAWSGKNVMVFPRSHLCSDVSGGTGVPESRGKDF